MYGLLWGAGMLVLDAIKNRLGAAKLAHLLLTAAGAVLVGMVKIFESRVFHGGLAPLFGTLLLIAFGAGFAYRRAYKRAEIASKVG